MERRFLVVPTGLAPTPKGVVGPVTWVLRRVTSLLGLVTWVFWSVTWFLEAVTSLASEIRFRLPRWRASLREPLKTETLFL